MTAFIAATWW